MGVTFERTDEKSLARMLDEPPPKGWVELSWTGQGGFIIASASACIAIDLYLSDTLAEKYRGKLFPHERMMEPPVQPQDLAGKLDFLLSTHAHTDHMDPGTIQPIYKDQFGKKPLCIVPRAEAETAVFRGVVLRSMVGINAEETIHKHGISVTAVPSSHEEIVYDEFGNSKYLGYIINLPEIRIYHSGDTIPYPGLIEKLASYKIDIALLPVNGRDEYRSSHGIPGNFTIDEACSLVREAGIPFLVPHHVGMFSFNTAGREQIAGSLAAHGFRELIDCIIAQPGEVYRFSREQKWNPTLVTSR